MKRRKYVAAVLAGGGMFLCVSLIDAFLAHVGLHAESTYLDDVLLGLIAAALALFLERQRELELRRQQRNAFVIAEMNHHIRNALQVILGEANIGLQNMPELREITDAVERIDWTLREILPKSNGEPLPLDPGWPPRIEEARSEQASSEETRDV